MYEYMDRWGLCYKVDKEVIDINGVIEVVSGVGGIYTSCNKVSVRGTFP